MRFQPLSHPLTLSILLLSFLIAAKPVLSQTLASVSGLDHQHPSPDELSTWEYMIITQPDLESAFQILADHRTAHGLPSGVVTLAWILENTPPGRDYSETIRIFLQQTHSAGNLRYVLLGADSPLVPARLVRTTVWPPGPDEYTDFPSDLYYACLDGDWDADGDGIFGEFYVGGEDPGDNPDLVPELAVGRAPVNNFDQALLFVAKVMTFENQGQLDYRRRGLFFSEVLNPEFWVPGEEVLLDGATFCEALLPYFTEADPPVQVTRLYQNYTEYPGAFPLSRQVLIESLNSGRYGLVHTLSHGDLLGFSVGNELFSQSDAAELQNGLHYFFISAFTVNAAAFDTTCMLEQFLWNPSGGCVAGVGPSTITYLSPGQLVFSAFWADALAASTSNLGTTMNLVFDQFAEQAAQSTVFHLIQMGFTLLGDPTLAICPPSPTAVAETAPGPEMILSTVSCVPNPFNPTTVIRFSIDTKTPRTIPTKVVIYSLTGRKIDTLLEDDLVPGEHEAIWRGEDSHGATMSSGVYLVRVRAGVEQATAKLVLIR